MSQQTDFTLQQLAQIALGGSSLEDINISLLHTIINILLKKLDCENEKVMIGGVPAENLQVLLQNCTAGPAIKIQENDVSAPMKEYNKIVELEEQVNILERSLEEHLAEHSFRIMSGTNLITQPCLTDFEIEEQKNETLSTLLKNEYLTKQLKEYISQPFNCRMNRLDIKLKKLSADIQHFMDDCSNAFAAMDKVEKLSLSLKSINKKISRESENLKKTMGKIQYNMDLKANNCDIGPFKKFFLERFDLINTNVQSEIIKETKPRALIHSIGSTCKLNKSELCEEEKASPMKSKKSVCSCDEGRNIRQIPLSERAQRSSLDEFLSRYSGEKLKLLL